jgi:hypothetical protein
VQFRSGFYVPGRFAADVGIRGAVSLPPFAAASLGYLQQNLLIHWNVR